MLSENKSRTYKDPAINLDCTEFEVNNWIASDFVVKELVPIVGVSPYPLDELLLLTAAVCRLKPTHIFEWGTHLGKSARIFWEISQKFQIPTEIHSIDLPDDIDHIEHPGEKRGIFIKDITDVKLYQGDGLQLSIELSKKIPGKFNPLFFVDGDHSYESVKRELEGIIDNFPGANIIVHDTFYQSEKSGYNIGPYKAIRDVLLNIPNKYRNISTNIGLPGMTLLYKP